MTSSKTQRAVALHDGGSACSQAVFVPFAEALGMDERLAHKVSGGLGGGVGRCGHTCGAVTGGVLALSLAYGAETSGDQDAKLATYDIVAKFIRQIETKYGSVECRTLLEGADLWTQEGRDKVKAEGLNVKVCASIIADAAMLVEKLLPTEASHG